MAAIALPVGYTPREYQLPFWRYMESGGKRYVGAWHRRAGKDHSIFSFVSRQAFKRKGLYWHMLPTYEMGRKIIWNGITGDGTRFIDLFPPQLVKRVRDDLMLVEFINGSIYQVVGGDDPDKLRGPNPFGVVMSEYAFFPNSGAWDVVRPILNENGGFAAFISTPQGRNHFYEILRQAEQLDGWFAEVLTVDDTRRPDGSPVITAEAIEEDRLSGMSQAMIDQEYYCSFDSPFEGAIYADEMREIKTRERITNIEWDPSLPVRTYWDLGINDLGAVWFVQSVGNKRIAIDYRQERDWSLQDWIKFVLNKPYIYEGHIGPWDLRHREQTTGKTREMAALKLGLRFDVAPRTRVEDGINEVRSSLRKHEWWFNAEKCRDGVDALLQYRWKVNKQGMPTKEPEHDVYSHGADAFRTGVIMDDFRFNDSIDLPDLAISDYDPFKPPSYIERDGRVLQPLAFDGESSETYDFLRRYG